MVTRVEDEVVERAIYRDEMGTTVYGGTKGRNYEVKSPSGFLTELLFQVGFGPTSPVNGLTNEILIATVIDRIKIQNGFQSCDQNVRALAHLEDALASLESRAFRRASLNTQA